MLLKYDRNDVNVNSNWESEKNNNGADQITKTGTKAIWQVRENLNYW